MKYLLLIILFSGISYSGYGQDLINLRINYYAMSDTIYIDSLTIVNGSIQIFDKENQKLDELSYSVDYERSFIVFDEVPAIDTVKIRYRVFRQNFTQPVYVFSRADFMESVGFDPELDRYVFSPADLRQTTFYQGSLSRRGSISRGISFGNTQNVIVNSNLNLQLEGKLTENLNIIAAITDNNIPIQPDGTAQQIQEFDRVFINLFTDDIDIIAGDFEQRRPMGYFMNYHKKVQGAQFSFKIPKSDSQNFSVESSVSGSIAKGKNHRMEFNGVEGNQGPYRLTGANNERYIVVLAGTERVYIDGILMRRGQDNDYIIDYNLGEIVFTSNQPINKDKRIIVEFEYSDRNYARFLFTSNSIVRTERSKFYLNIFSEGDQKNQPFDQDLRDEDKLLLSLIGDNIDQALIPGFDSVGFAGDEIRYAMKDTIVNNVYYDSIFVYSNDENIAHYRIRFALVGENQGNYKKSVSAANGRVFEWVAPVNGVPQGNYMPMRLIITPKKNQLYTIGAVSEITNSTKIDFELGISNNDINTFSELDSENNVGAAFKLGLTQQIYKSEKNSLKTTLGFENIRENFQAIEQFRSQEFRRDWNLDKTISDNNEYISSFGLHFNNINAGNANYGLSYLNRESIFEGLKHSFRTDLRLNKWEINANASLLNTDDNFNNTRFLRHKTVLSRDVGIFVIGVSEHQEFNKWTSPTGDTLRKNSFNFNEFEAFIKTNDTVRNEASLIYRYRIDDLPFEDELKRSTEAHDLGLRTAIVSNPNNRISTSFNYRRLYVKDTLLYSDRPEDNMTGRLEHNMRIFNGAVSTSSYYEIGSGLERKIEFSYLEVAPGQGVYQWTDYNNNGIQELDEFEVAHFQDEANFIRIITPTDDFIKTYTNMFNQQIMLNPESVWRNEKGLKKLLSRFSNRFAYRLSSKNTSSDFKEFANPFARNIDDISLVSMTSSVRNSLAFNRSNPKFNLEYIFQTNNNKMLLVSGFDTREFTTNNIRLNSQVLSTVRLENEFSIGEKSFDSEYFENRNYDIDMITNDFSVNYQPNINNRFRLSYIYQIKNNAGGIEDLTGHNMGFEYRMSSVNRGTLNFQVNYVFLDYIGDPFGPIAYEMLEGLLPGSNYTWTFGFQRQLANGLQINLNYNGRKSEDSQAVHTGGVQLRAYF